MDKAGNCHARFSTASEHSLNRIEDAVIDAFPERQMQGRGGFGKTHRKHDEAFQKNSRNLRSPSYSTASSKSRVQQRAGPLACQSGGNLLLADESERSEPLSNPSAARGALGFQRGPQLFRGNVVPGEQQKAEREAMRGRCPLGARRQPLEGVIQRTLQAWLGAVSRTLQQDARSMPAKAAPNGASVDAVSSSAARRKLFPNVPATSAQLIEVKVCDSHTVLNTCRGNFGDP